MKEILQKVKEFIDTKQSSRQWQPGKDFVNYAGPYFDSDEYVAAVETILNGWLVMGDLSLQFERKFPQFFGKQYGILTNSGSSSNLLNK